MGFIVYYGQSPFSPRGARADRLPRRHKTGMDKQWIYRSGYWLGHTLLTRAFSWLLRYQAPRLPDIPEPYILLPNHSFELDFTLVMRTFPRYTRFVIGETVFQNGLLRRLLFALHDPVIIRKSGTDMRAVLDMLHRLRQGQNICLFAEGDTTFDGVTGQAHPGTAALVKAAGATLVTFRVHGGYFSRPRWSGTYRRGRSWGEVAGVYSPQQLKEMTIQQVEEIIQRDLQVDAAEDQQARPVAYRGRRLAEGIENLLYLCPGCQQVGTLRGHGQRVGCQNCGFACVYTPYGTLKGAPHTQLKDWARWQRQQLALALEQGTARVADKGQTLRLIREDHSLEQVAQGDMAISAQGLTVGDAFFPLHDIAGMAIFRSNRLMFTTREGNYYDIDPRLAGSALKYRDAFQLLAQKE